MSIISVALKLPTILTGSSGKLLRAAHPDDLIALTAKHASEHATRRIPKLAPIERAAGSSRAGSDLLTAMRTGENVESSLNRIAASAIVEASMRTLLVTGIPAASAAYAMHPQMFDQT